MRNMGGTVTSGVLIAMVSVVLPYPAAASDQPGGAAEGSEGIGSLFASPSTGRLGGVGGPSFSSGTSTFGNGGLFNLGGAPTFNNGGLFGSGSGSIGGFSIFGSSDFGSGGSLSGP